MSRIRAALLGVVISVPAALVLPGAIPAAAASCGTSGFGGPSVSSVQTTGGQPAHGPAGSTVVINGSSFGSSGTVYFNGSSTAATVRSWSSNQVVVLSPSGATTGPLTICGNDLLAPGPTTTSQSYYYPPVVNGYSTSAASEGQTFTINGQNFVSGVSVTMNGCGVNASYSSPTRISAAVPGYQCSGTITVKEPVPGATDGSTQQGSGPGFSVTPTIGNPSTSSAKFGDPISVGGSGFGASGTVTVGGVSAQPTSWSDSQVTFQAPDGTDGGPVSVYTAGGTATTSGTVAIEPQITGVSPNPIHEGDILTISGHNLGNPSKAGSVAMGSQALNVTGWSWQTVTAEVPTPAVPGGISLTRADDGATTNGPSETIQPVITNVSPSSGGPGTFVTISGTGFSQSPTVTIGGKTAQVALGGDNSIAVTVPSGASTGKVVVTSSYGQAATWGEVFTVPAGSSSGSGGGGGGTTSSSGGAGGPIIIKPNYGFLQLPKPPTPIGFHITAPAVNVKPGATVPLTVTLQLNGKPVAGSAITLEVFRSPGSDTLLSPLSGTTDQNGTFTARLKTSKKAGQTIVVAKSGEFGDSITITAVSPAANSILPRTLITNSTLDPHILIPFVGALILAVLLLLGAVVLQWRLHRRAMIPAAAGAPAEAAAVEAVVPEPAAPKRRRLPKRKAPAPPAVEAVTAEPAPAEPLAAVAELDEEPAALAPAVGAEDVVVADGAEPIAPVIPLRGGDISRTRGRTKAGE